jgi:Uma2 family endonuclease
MQGTRRWARKAEHVMAIPFVRKRFTTHDFHLMAEAGILGEDDRYELIAGEIVEMAAIGAKHANYINRLNLHAVRELGDTYVISVQNSVQLSINHEPQPDLMILRWRDDYDDRVPTSDDVMLLIEVADSALQYDRKVKLPLYAKAGIPEVWIVDVNGLRLTRYSQPDGEIYQVVRRARRGQALASTTIPGFAIPFEVPFGRA